MSTKRHNLNQSILYKCKSKKTITTLLGLQANEFSNINQIIKYNNFEIIKNNKKREITEPDARLKLIQTKILKLLTPIDRPDWLISGEKGKSYVDNARRHQASSYTLTIDIKSFYPNCKRENVYSFFSNKLFMIGDIAKLCTDIVTYNGVVPTGCPTSQIIAYYAYENMFLELAEVSKVFNCTYSVYVDDLTFSSTQPFDVHKLKANIFATLKKYGHKPSIKIIRYFGIHQSKTITGVIITPDHRLVAPNKLQHTVVKGLHKLNSSETFTVKEFQILKGKINAIQSIEPNKFEASSRKVKLLEQTS